MPGKMQGYTGTRYTHLGTQPDRQEVSWPSRAHSPSLMFTLACLLMMHPLAQWSQILHSPQFFSLFLAVKQDNFFFLAWRQHASTPVAGKTPLLNRRSSELLPSTPPLIAPSFTTYTAARLASGVSLG